MIELLTQLFSFSDPGVLMSFGPLAAIGVGSLLGGIAGGATKQQNQTGTRRVSLVGQSDLDRQLQEQQPGQFNDLRDLINAGPGMQDITAATGSQRDLASLLEQLQSTSGLPTQQDIGQAQGFASDVFAPQRLQQSQEFTRQRETSNQLAAQLGRPVNDPILAAKLARSQTEQSGVLAAQQGSFGAQFAQQLPQQRLGFASQLANVRGGLATQALANRQALLSMGQQMQAAERQFRLAQSPVTTTGQTSTPGGVSGMIGGALAGAGTFARFGNMFSGGGNTAQVTPTPPGAMAPSLF